MYAMVGFDWGDGKFGYWIVMYICSMSCFTFFGQFLVYVTPNPMLAQVSFAWPPPATPAIIVSVAWHVAMGLGFCTKACTRLARGQSVA